MSDISSRFIIIHRNAFGGLEIWNLRSDEWKSIFKFSNIPALTLSEIMYKYFEAIYFYL